jgi:tRNA G10  N-methylase Trm11
MKNIYFASFAAGMRFVVEDILKKQIQDVKILRLFENAVLFETGNSYSTLNMFCFNNIFSVIAFTEKKNPMMIENFIRQIADSGIQSKVISNNTKKYKSFRVVVSSENRLVQVADGLKKKIEKLISSQSRLVLDKSNPDAEFWVSRLNDGFCCFMKRLSKHSAYNKILNKGELHPEIAFMMNWLAEADKNDLVLDPFCGYGAILVMRALHFPTKQIFAFDRDVKMVNIAKKKLAKRKSLANMKNILVKKVDIKDLDKELPPESVDKIVTDPPWGEYVKLEMGVNEYFYFVLSQLEKVLKNGGIIVMLAGREIDIASLLSKFPNLSLLQNYNMLVSGKKANMVKIIKKTPEKPTSAQSSVH